MPRPASQRFVRIIGDKPVGSLAALREAFDYREVLFLLWWREVKAKYKQARLGALWGIVYPLMSMVVFTLFFGLLVRVPSQGLPYPVFVYAALLPWTLFSNGLRGAADSLVNHMTLISRTYFPRFFAPLIAVGVEMVDFLISSLIFAGLLAYYQVSVGWSVLYVVPAVLITAALTVGVGLILAAWQAVWRDVRYMVAIATQALFFGSPIVYPVTFVPDSWRILLSLNPLTGIIELFRSALLGTTPPWIEVAAAAVLAVIALVAGWLLFGRVQRRVVDVI